MLYRTLEVRVLQQLDHAVEMVSERSFPVTESVILRLNKLLGTSLMVFDSNGKHSQFQGGMMQPKGLTAALNSHYQQWYAQDEIRGKIYFEFADRDYLLVLRKPNIDEPVRYQAVAALSDLSDVRNATRRGGMWLAWLAAGGISLLAFLGHWIARSITRPVGELAAMAGLLAAGDRAVRADVHRQDEVGALAHSLNSMAERLEMYEQHVAEQSRLVTLGELSAKVAHEVRNPLTAIKMQLQLLEDELPESGKLKVNALISEVRRLELIVSTTLQLGRPDQLDCKMLELNFLVTEVLELLAPQFEHRGIDTIIDLAADLPQCSLDANRVKQILLNLINNAADALPGGGRIGVVTRLENRGVVLEVLDSGPGIAAGQREHLFDKASSDKPSGFGLGLRVTRELVELHGGTIEAGDSEYGGALFRVVFPQGS